MSSTITLVDFEDLYTAIAEELKVQSSDGTTITRIKRDINMVYLDEVVPFHDWWWLRASTNLQTVAKLTTGTVSVTNGSTTITFSSAPAADLDNYLVNVTGTNEVYKITAHTAGNANATIEAPYTGVTNATAGYTVWKNFAALPADCRSVISVTHDNMPKPMIPEGFVNFRERQIQNTVYSGRPIYYTTEDFDASGQRLFRWYPALNSDVTTMHIEYQQEATRLSADSDEPAMPVEDRIVLFYGACARAWVKERNEGAYNRNWGNFVAKLNQMAGKSGDTPDKVRTGPDPQYLFNKRYFRLRKRRGSSWSND